MEWRDDLLEIPHMAVSYSRSPVTRSIGLGASLLLNVVLLVVVFWPDGQPPAPSLSTVEVTQAQAEVAAIEPPPSSVADALEANDGPGVVKVAGLPAAAPKNTKGGDGATQVTIASVKGSIPQTLAEAAAPYGDNVSATLSRLLVWDMDLRRDLRAGDTIEAMWAPATSDGVVIEAARFGSQKLNRTLTAYRFKAAADHYPSYWSADGTEIPHRLRNSPLATYEQITSLLRDRPTHHGMDFKVDVGTPVTSPFDGEVTRVNWNTAANGGCVEIRHKDGVLAKHLHLSKVEVKAGTQVRAGQVIALSGNTGRSTGPHLHYQLNRGTTVVDPIEYHGTDRRKLADSERAAFAEIVAAANARLDGARER
ncbi:MAG: M23 family metallopeptidase [Bradymonadaceae bacterium]|nr:M23 family metallopeptidase [Lujinxingiaceae bacterium]